MATRQTFLSGTADDPVNTGAGEFSCLMGDGELSWSATEANKESIISTPGKLTNFKVGIKTAPGDGKSWTFTIRLGNSGGAMAATALSVAISGSTAVLSALDTDEVAVAAGQRVTIVAVPTGTPTACAAVYWRCDFIPDTAGETLLLSSTAGVGLTVNRHHTLIGGKNPDVTEFDGQTLFPTSGVLKRLYVELAAAPGNGNSRTFTVQKNGEVMGLVVAISEGNTTGNDTDPAHNVTIAAGDKVTIKNTTSGSPATSAAKFGVTFLPDTLGEWITSATTEDATNTDNVEYQHLNCGDSTLTTDETEQHGLAPGTIAKKIYVNLDTSPGADNTWIFTLREGLADTALTVSLTNAQTGNAAVDEAVAADALVDILIDARAGAAVSKSQIAILFYNAPTGGVERGPVNSAVKVGVLVSAETGTDWHSIVSVAIGVLTTASRVATFTRLSSVKEGVLVTASRLGAFIRQSPIAIGIAVTASRLGTFTRQSPIPVGVATTASRVATFLRTVAKKYLRWDV